MREIKITGLKYNQMYILLLLKKLENILSSANKCTNKLQNAPSKYQTLIIRRT